MRLLAVMALLLALPLQAANLPRTVVTSSGIYIVVPNSITGETMAIIKTSRPRGSK